MSTIGDDPIGEVAKLGFHELEISQVSTNLAVLGFYICVIGLASYFVKERLFVSDALVAVCIGIAVGPEGLNWTNVSRWAGHDEEQAREIIFSLVRITLGIQLVFTGVALPKKYLRHHWLSLFMLLIPIMTSAWLISALIMWLIFPNFTYLEALVIAACITPTDPVLAASVVKGRFAEKKVPVYVRNIIAAESGANDGLGFPFIYLALFLVERNTRNHSLGWAIWQWIVQSWIYDIMLSCVIGIIIGWVASKSLKFARERGLIDHESFLAYGIGLAFFTLGVCGTIGTDDILCTFVVGNVFTWDDYYRVETEDHAFQDVIDIIVDTAIFIFIGTLIPWSDFTQAEWGLLPWQFVVTAICVLLFRRLPWVMLGWKTIPDLHTWKEAVFAGWFGPMGVGALYYLELALRELPPERTRLLATIRPAVLMIILSSVLVHGVTIPLFSLHVKLRKTYTNRKMSLPFAFEESATIDGPDPRFIQAAATTDGAEQSEKSATKTTGVEAPVEAPQPSQSERVHAPDSTVRPSTVDPHLQSDASQGKNAPQS